MLKDLRGKNLADHRLLLRLWLQGTASRDLTADVDETSTDVALRLAVAMEQPCCLTVGVAAFPLGKHRHGHPESKHVNVKHGRHA